MMISYLGNSSAVLGFSCEFVASAVWCSFFCCCLFFSLITCSVYTEPRQTNKLSKGISLTFNAYYKQSCGTGVEMPQNSTRYNRLMVQTAIGYGNTQVIIQTFHASFFFFF